MFLTKTAQQLCNELFEAAKAGERLEIGVDADDVLVDYASVQRARFPGLPNDEIAKLDWLSFHREVLPTLQPLPDAVEPIASLALQHNLTVVTSREEEFRGVTIDTMEAFFPGCFTDVRCVAQKGDKQKACQELGLAALVDNSEYHVIGAAQVGVLGIHIDLTTPDRDPEQVRFWSQHMVVNSHEMLARILTPRPATVPAIL